jgi:hypothetical protein
MPVCYLRLAVESNPYAVDFKGGQSFGEAQGGACQMLVRDRDFRKAQALTRPFDRPKMLGI